MIKKFLRGEWEQLAGETGAEGHGSTYDVSGDDKPGAENQKQQHTPSTGLVRLGVAAGPVVCVCCEVVVPGVAAVWYDQDLSGRVCQACARELLTAALEISLAERRAGL